MVDGNEQRAKSSHAFKTQEVQTKHKSNKKNLKIKLDISIENRTELSDIDAKKLMEILLN